MSSVSSFFVFLTLVTIVISETTNDDPLWNKDWKDPYASGDTEQATTTESESVPPSTENSNQQCYNKGFLQPPNIQLHAAFGRFLQDLKKQANNIDIPVSTNTTVYILNVPNVELILEFMKHTDPDLRSRIDAQNAVENLLTRARCQPEEERYITLSHLFSEVGELLWKLRSMEALCFFVANFHKLNDSGINHFWTILIVIFLLFVNALPKFRISISRVIVFDPINPNASMVGIAWTMVWNFLYSIEVKLFSMIRRLNVTSSGATNQSSESNSEVADDSEESYVEHDIRKPTFSDIEKLKEEMLSSRTSSTGRPFLSDESKLGKTDEKLTDEVSTSEKEQPINTSYVKSVVVEEQREAVEECIEITAAEINGCDSDYPASKESAEHDEDIQHSTGLEAREQHEMIEEVKDLPTDPKACDENAALSDHQTESDSFAKLDATDIGSSLEPST